MEEFNHKVLGNLEIKAIDKKTALLQKKNTKDYIIASSFDKDTKSWGSGTYLYNVDVSTAFRRFSRYCY